MEISEEKNPLNFRLICELSADGDLYWSQGPLVNLISKNLIVRKPVQACNVDLLYVKKVLENQES